MNEQNKKVNNHRLAEFFARKYSETNIINRKKKGYLKRYP